MDSTLGHKSEDELLKEIEELEKLVANIPRRSRGIIRHGSDQPAPKRRISSPLIKSKEDIPEPAVSSFQRHRPTYGGVQSTPRTRKAREDSKENDRGKRIFSSILHTLTNCQKDEERERQESEKLHQEYLTRTAPLSAKIEEIELELLTRRWSKHHEAICKFPRTEAEPRIFYKLPKESDYGPGVAERKEKAFEQWKKMRVREYTRNSCKAAENLQETIDIMDNVATTKLDEAAGFG